MDIIATVRKFIVDNRLLEPGDTVCIGVSGGPDSVALLYVLKKLAGELGLKIFVGHVNHQMRKSAETDQRFVEKLCRVWQIPCYVVRVKIDGKGSLEERAREKRLNALVRLAKQKKSAGIALAHHADDLAETVLLRIIRGTGLAGLTGMRPKRSQAGINIIRPFLAVKKSEIDRLIKKQRLPFRIDPTNRQKKFLRNRIRLELMPLLKKYNSNITEILANLSRSAAIDYDYLREQAQAELKKLLIGPSAARTVKIRLKPLTDLHKSMRRMVLRISIETVKGDLRRLVLKHFDEIDELIFKRPTGSVVNLPAQVRITKKSGIILISCAVNT